MIVTLLAKTQLYELTIIAVYGDMYIIIIGLCTGSYVVDYCVDLCRKWKVYFITSN